MSVPFGQGVRIYLIKLDNYFFKVSSYPLNRLSALSYEIIYLVNINGKTEKNEKICCRKKSHIC